MKMIFLLIFLFPALVFAQDRPPLVSARSYLVADYGSGQLLLANKIHDRIEPASLTKLMTAYIAFGALKEKRLKLNGTLPVSEKSRDVAGSRMFLQPGNAAPVDGIVRGLVVDAANDAAVTLAEGIAGSEEKFVATMNKEAARLGMKETHFANATGLPAAGNYSSAFDLYLLAGALIRDFPEYYPYFSQKEYQYNGIMQQNRNRLLWLDPSVDGLLTGHSEGSGYCLVSSQKKGGRRLISVLLGAESDALRASESLKMLNYSFEAFDAMKLFSKEQPVTELRVWKGTRDTLKAGFMNDFYLSVPKGRAGEIKAVVAAQEPLPVPIARGQRVGVVKFTLDGRLLGEFPVVALEEVGRANIFKSAWDSIKMLFN